MDVRLFDHETQQPFSIRAQSGAHYILQTEAVNVPGFVVVWHEGKRLGVVREAEIPRGVRSIKSAKIPRATIEVGGTLMAVKSWKFSSK